MSKGKRIRGTRRTATIILTKHFSFYLKDRGSSIGGGRLEYTQGLERSALGMSQLPRRISGNLPS